MTSIIPYKITNTPFFDTLKFAVDIIFKAGDILIKGFNQIHKIHFKGKIDLVTEKDKESEDFLVNQIINKFPNHSILTEESQMSQQLNEFIWVIDPLDGTTNYAHNFPVFSISIAFTKSFEPIWGIVYNPLSKELFIGYKNYGAYLNGSPISVSKIEQIDKSLLATGFPYDVHSSPHNNIDHFANFILKSQGIRRCGVASLDLCFVACGRLDGFWEPKLKPWDTAAGYLIVTEANGKVTDFLGNQYNIFKNNILASNGLIHQQMINILKTGSTLINI